MMKLRILLAIIFAAILVGCSALPESGTSEAFAVNYLLAKSTQQVIDGDADRRTEVLDAVSDARSFVEASDTVTIGLLYEGAMERIDSYNLDPISKQALREILGLAKARLETAISAEELDPDEKLAILDALNWIEAAARGES